MLKVYLDIINFNLIVAYIVANSDMIDLSQYPTPSMRYSIECNFDYFEVDLYVQLVQEFHVIFSRY